VLLTLLVAAAVAAAPRTVRAAMPAAAMPTFSTSTYTYTMFATVEIVAIVASLAPQDLRSVAFSVFDKPDAVEERLRSLA
jgi:hypothetical protein